MYLLLFTLIALVFAVWFIWRDRRYRQKELEDVVSEEMKKDLNLPGADNQFEKDLADRQAKETTSKEILKSFNK